MLNTHPQLSIRRLAALALSTAFASLHAQLPAAPSAVLSAPHIATQPAAQYPQYAAMTTPAGSGKTYTPAGTIAGPGGLRIEQPTDAPLALSIDDAIAFGLERNLRLQYDRANLNMVRGDLYQVGNALIPSLSVTASSNAQELNLAAMGFNPKSIKLPTGTPPIATIVKVNVTQALLNLNQTLFNLPAYELYRGAQDESKVVNLNTLSGRGELVQAVGNAYLQIIADKSSVTNAVALEAAAKTLFNQATGRRDAGVGTNLDALRGQVEFQTRQQQRIAAESALAKDTIQLDRILGLPAGQKLTLTDAVPYAELADMDLDRARATAFDRRKDYLALLAEIRVADRERRAVKFERLPTLGVGGYYGVQGVTDGLYHGIFRAVGTLQFPIFREAAQRGETEVVTAQLTSLRQREADLRVAIDGQLRSALLDVATYRQTVQIAQSNVALSQAELADVRDRFVAGIDDNLPVVDAEASLAGAQNQLVRALFQFNAAKLQLARNTGIIESQYRVYLGTTAAASPPPLAPPSSAGPTPLSN